MCGSKTSWLCAQGVCGGVEQCGLGDGLAAGLQTNEGDFRARRIRSESGGSAAQSLHAG